MKIKNYKKILAFCILVIFLFLLSLPSAMANSNSNSNWNGLVPCGGYKTADPSPRMCTLCHLVVGIRNLFNYAFLIFVGLALLMLVVAGIMYITSAGNSAMMEAAKKLMKNVLAGFALVLGAWLIVNYTMIILGAKPQLGINESSAQPTTPFQFWHRFDCNSTSSVNSSNSGITPVGGGGNTTGGGGNFGGGGAGGGY